MMYEEMNTPEFNEESFWSKLTKKVLKLCRGVAEQALTLFFCMIDKDTPAWAKAKIAAALGYFVFPVDAIPDAIPVVGYSDDAAVLAMAVTTVITHIKPEHRARAKETIETILGRRGNSH